MAKAAKLIGCTWKEFVLIAIGSFLVAYYVTWLADPFGLVAGGVSGIAIVVKELTQLAFGTGVALSITNLVLNIPLFLVGVFQRGFKFAQKSLYSVVLTSVFLELCKYLPNVFNVGDDLFLASVFGGALIGLGIGLVLKANASTGGTDMLAAILQHKRPHMPVSNLLLVIDGLIILSGLFVFGPIRTMYAIISVFISTKVINWILEGGRSARAAYIFSEQYEAISQKIFDTINRGNTAIYTRGMYTKRDSKTLMVIVSRKEIGILRQIVHEIDPQAFMIISEVKDVLGEGFVEDYTSAIS